MARRAHQLLGEQGDLSAYLAVAMLLPLLLLLAYGGAEAIHALGTRSAVDAASFEALRVAEDQGGVSSSLAASLTSRLETLAGLVGVSVTGTAPGQPWGQPVCIRVNAPGHLSLPAGSLSLQFGGSFCGTSDLPPSAP